RALRAMRSAAPCARYACRDRGAVLLVAAVWEATWLTREFATSDARRTPLQRGTHAGRQRWLIRCANAFAQRACGCSDRSGTGGRRSTNPRRRRGSRFPRPDASSDLTATVKAELATSLDPTRVRRGRGRARRRGLAAAM